MNRFSEVEELVMGLRDDFAKFYEKDNKAAGTRVRAGMQSLKKLAQEIRAQVTELKNQQAVVAAAPVKAKAKAAPAKAAPAKKAPAKKK